MYYAIDYDTRTVEAKSEELEPLENYILKNDLNSALATVSSEDDLEMQLSLDEMTDLYININIAMPKGNITFKNEEVAAKHCWDALESNKDNFNDFGSVPVTLPGIVKQVKVKGTIKVPKAKSTKSGVTAKSLEGKVFCAGPKDPRKNTSFAIFRECLDDNMDEATFDELVRAFIDNYVPKTVGKPVDKSLGRAYVRDAFNGGYIEEAL